MGNKPRIRFKGFTEDWEQRKLGEFVKIISGDAPSTFISGRCIYVKVDDLNYSDRIQLSSSNLVNINPKAHLVNKGATIFPKRGAAIMTNKVRIMGKDGYLDTNMMALIPEEIDKDFLFTFIQKTGLYKIADTSTIPQINNKHIEPYMIQVPNDKEQECIGVVFEKIDKIITLHQCKLEKLKLTKKALLQKLFPKNGKHIPEIRFKGFTDAWEQRKFKDIAFKRGKISEADLPYIEFEDINSGIGTLNKNILQKVGHKKGILFEAGDVLFGKLRPYLQNWLLCQFMGIAVGDFWVFQPQIVSSAFLYYLIQSEAYQSVANISSGTKMPRSSWSLVSESRFSIPKYKEATMIGEFFTSIDKNITLHQRKLERLQEVKKGLLQKMFV